MEKEIAKILLDIKAVFLKPNDPFTWASGIKSPIYCDNRLILSYPKQRTFVYKALSKLILEKYPDCEVIMGTSTAGIAPASIVSDYLNLPMGYVRGSAKDHGRTNLIEGVIPENKKVVVIEDTISTAGSSIDVCSVLKDNKAIVLGIASIYTYDLEKGLNNLKNANILNYSLTNFDSLVNVALENNYISEVEVEKLFKFRSNPQDSSWIN